ncbi:MAG: NTP transferase domain-containing protein [Rickettsiales bacterium]|jgi:UTP-glucose-1-phosphate uridylyltransferase|nr:NTP transferase domain-containing protein [Rickettsiales bacterium]
MDDIEFIILAAGKSTRNYPHSKGIPHKSLVPFGSRKIIDYIIREPISAGVRHITIVVSDERAREAFELCFTREENIEEKFKKSGNLIGLELLQSLYLPSWVDLKYVIQPEPKGLAHAVGLANKVAGGRHLAVRMPDDMVLKKNPGDGGEGFVVRALKKYVADGVGGHMFCTRKVDDPSRWGIIEDGVFREKPVSSKSRDAAHTLWFFDRASARVQEEMADRADTPGTPEWSAAMGGKELHHNDFLNHFIEKNPKMKIRTFPVGPDEVYLDCGTLAGYEEALIYMLLNDSAFKERNKETARRFI